MVIGWINVKDRLPEIPPDQHAVSVLAVVYDPVYEEICPGKGRSVEAILWGYDKKGIARFLDVGTGPKGTMTVPITDQVICWMYYPELPEP